MHIIDTCGLTCPAPLIRLKETMLELQPGEELEVITDNETSLRNLLSYLGDQGASTEENSRQGVHHIRTVVPAGSVAASDPAAYCATGAVNSDYVVCLKGKHMGEGDAELGKLLMETFLDHLKLQEHLPTHVIMYTESVRLALKGTSTCASLGELEELGVRIMICGTCVDHFGVQYDIGVGMISNMVSITETLVKTGHVVTP